MMLKEILGNVRDIDISNKIIEKLELEWFELDKRLLRKVTDRGTEVGIVLDGVHRLEPGDVLYVDDEKIMVIELLPAQAIVLEPGTMWEMAQISYQLGNRHAPIFLDHDQVLVPFDPTLVELFRKIDIQLSIENRRLEHALQPASSHSHSH